MTDCCACGAGGQNVLIFAGSGASNVGQLANDLASPILEGLSGA